MQAILDRFEGDFAILECEDNSALSVPRYDVDSTAAEGDILNLTGGKWIPNKEATLSRKDYIQKLMDDIIG